MYSSFAFDILSPNLHDYINRQAVRPIVTHFTNNSIILSEQFFHWRKEKEMNINFAMWRKASSQLIKMEDKKEWDSLDVVSKWLIATRSAVTLVTVYSCVIAGLLATYAGIRLMR